jgi:hypothetical protein
MNIDEAYPDWTLEEEEAITKLSAMLTAVGTKTEGAQIGRKFDGGKLDYTLVPFEALDEIVKVLMFGAQKYDRDNWRHVDNAMQRYAAAAFRHLTAYNKGELVDAETTLSHLAHAGCCLLFMLALEKQHGKDARSHS